MHRPTLLWENLNFVVIALSTKVTHCHNTRQKYLVFFHTIIVQLGTSITEGSHNNLSTTQASSIEFYLQVFESFYQLFNETNQPKILKPGTNFSQGSVAAVTR